MYLITHTYLTVDDDGKSVVELETATVTDAEHVPGTVRLMMTSPGGRAGTTLALTVAITEPVRP